MKLPQIGELRRRIGIYTLSTAPTGDSGYADTLTKLTDTWAKVEVVGGVNYWGSIQADFLITHRFTVRYGKGTRPEDFKHTTKVQCEGVWYLVKRATDMEAQHRFTILECEAQYDGAS